MSLFLPDYAFGKFDDITVGFLKKEGCSSLIIDIDNTLAPYEEADPNERVIRWFDELGRAGIKAALVSNNGRERVERFNRQLGLTAFWDCRKPDPKFVKTAMAAIGARKESTVYLGDQIFTDTLAAKLAGIRAIKLPPIKDKKTLLFRIKRKLEKPVMQKYYRLHPDEKIGGAQVPPGKDKDIS